MKREVDALDSMADKYFTKKALGPDLKQMQYIMQRVTSCLRGPRVLELGCGSGQWTEKLIARGYQVSVVEGSSVLAQNLRVKVGERADVVHSLFEEFKPSGAFNDVIASCVLEHVSDSNEFLCLVRSWLSEAGHLHVVVPNALSMHRRVGYHMGLLDDPMALSPQELEVGHRRSYTAATFRSELEGSGLVVNSIKGIFLKPLSSAQMLEWPDALLDGYNSLSDELPEFTAFLYADCT